MKLFIGKAPEVVAKAKPAPVSIPEKPKVTVTVKPKLALPDSISDDDLEALQQQILNVAKELKEKKGIVLDPKEIKKDTTWANDFKTWLSKRGFRFDPSDLSDLRVDFYKEEENNYQWRICIVRSYTTYNFGFYFNIFAGGHPRSLEFHGVDKANAIKALEYMYNALSLFEV